MENCNGSSDGHAQEARLRVRRLSRRPLSAVVRCPSLGQRGGRSSFESCWRRRRDRGRASTVDVARGHDRLQDTEHRPVRLDRATSGDGRQRQRRLQRHATHDVRRQLP